MTRYEQGFMNKCAEYGVDGRVLLEKRSSSVFRTIFGKSKPLVYSTSGQRDASRNSFIQQGVADYENPSQVQSPMRNLFNGMVNPYGIFGGWAPFDRNRRMLTPEQRTAKEREFGQQWDRENGSIPVLDLQKPGFAQGPIKNPVGTVDGFRPRTTPMQAVTGAARAIGSGYVNAFKNYNPFTLGRRAGNWMRGLPTGGGRTLGDRINSAGEAVGTAVGNWMSR